MSQNIKTPPALKAACFWFFYGNRPQILWPKMINFPTRRILSRSSFSVFPPCVPQRCAGSANLQAGGHQPRLRQRDQKPPIPVRAVRRHVARRQAARRDPHIPEPRWVSALLAARNLIWVQPRWEGRDWHYSCSTDNDSSERKTWTKWTEPPKISRLNIKSSCRLSEVRVQWIYVLASVTVSLHSLLLFLIVFHKTEGIFSHGTIVIYRCCH